MEHTTARRGVNKTKSPARVARDQQRAQKYRDSKDRRERLALERHHAWLELADLNAFRTGGRLDSERDRIEKDIGERLELIDDATRELEECR